MATWSRCISQIRALGDFAEGFDTSLISLTKDENRKDYPNAPPDVEVPMSNEFYSLLPGSFLHALDGEAKESWVAIATKN
ncbi:UNVERIFIED_CONTAM: hypothetical protein Slati_2906200 [Sesamum latifolium]|uniref:Uncharacterized protein n=1 Tax=Sesamum latifolium TaxID=2727402 RepID=A0AAW2VC32_9LAMI